jgi:hypothetical protein
VSPLAGQGYDFRQLRLVARMADTVTIRLLLAWASFLYAVLLLFPSFFTFIIQGLRWALFLPQVLPVDPIAVFDRPAYAVMALIPGQEWTWATLFLLHWAGVHWRIVDRRERERWALAVNGLGFVTWAYSTISINISLGTVGPSTALEWILVGFSGWALYRTGLHKEMVTQ